MSNLTTIQRWKHLQPTSFPGSLFFPPPGVLAGGKRETLGTRLIFYKLNHILGLRDVSSSVPLNVEHSQVRYKRCNVSPWDKITRSLTRNVWCKSNLQFAHDCRVRPENCWRILKRALKPVYDNRGRKQRWKLYAMFTRRERRLLSKSCATNLYRFDQPW